MEYPHAKTKEKADKLSDSMYADLRRIVELYFSNFEENKENFDKLNLEWKKHCYNINRRQKLFRFSSSAFEIEVDKVISNNPQFQPKIVDFTKLSEVI